MSAIVRKYLTQDLSDDEKGSYLEYVRGNEKSTDWIEKALLRRDPLLMLELKCKSKENGKVCDKWVSIRETGVCKCSDGHDCCEQVLEALKNLT